MRVHVPSDDNVGTHVGIERVVHRQMDLLNVGRRRHRALEPAHQDGPSVGSRLSEKSDNIASQTQTHIK